MLTQVDHATTFATMHTQGNPLILYNVWDAGSAKVMEQAGVKAIATSSLSVAASHGFQDGEQLPFGLAIANLRRIVSVVDLPVTFDMEGGYGQRVETIRQNVIRVVETGAVGINFEDQIVGEEGLYSIEIQCNRIAAIRQIADQMSVPLFINARTDIFLKQEPSTHHQGHLEEALDRATAYAESGASGFFVPGLQNPQFIGRLCRELPIPVNTMCLPHAPAPQQMAELGVARISYGPYPYLQLMNKLQTEAHIAF